MIQRHPSLRKKFKMKIKIVFYRYNLLIIVMGKVGTFSRGVTFRYILCISGEIKISVHKAKNSVQSKGVSMSLLSLLWIQHLTMNNRRTGILMHMSMNRNPENIQILLDEYLSIQFDLGKSCNENFFTYKFAIGSKYLNGH